MLGIKGIEAIEFGSGDVSLRDQGLDRPPEGGFVGDALLEAAARQDAELDFRHIQPTAVLGGRSSMDPSRVDWESHLASLNESLGLSKEGRFAVSIPGLPPFWFNGDVEGLADAPWTLVVSLNHQMGTY